MATGMPAPAILHSLSREELCNLLNLATEIDLDMAIDSWEIRNNFQIFTRFAIHNLEDVVATDLTDGRISFGVMVVRGSETTVD